MKGLKNIPWGEIKAGGIALSLDYWRCLLRDKVLLHRWLLKDLIKLSVRGHVISPKVAQVSQGGRELYKRPHDSEKEIKFWFEYLDIVEAESKRLQRPESALSVEERAYGPTAPERYPWPSNVPRETLDWLGRHFGERGVAHYPGDR